MRKLLTALAVSLLALVATRLDAATAPASITFTRPTTWSNGSPLAASDIAGYQVECQFTATGSTSSVPCTLTGAPLAGGTSQSGSVTVTYPPIGGQACFSLRTVAVGGMLSPGSTPPACKTLPALTPSDPSNVTITVTLAISIKSDAPVTVAMSAPVVTGPER